MRLGILILAGCSTPMVMSTAAITEGHVVDIAATTPVISGSCLGGVGQPDTRFVLGILDSSKSDCAGPPKPFFGINPQGQIVGETVTYLRQQVSFLQGVDTVLTSGRSDLAEGGELILKGAPGSVTPSRGGSWRVYGGDAMGGWAAGGVVMDAGDGPLGDAGSVAQHDCPRAVGDIQVGACKAKTLHIGRWAKTDGTPDNTATVVKAGASGIIMRSTGPVYIYDSTIDPDNAGQLRLSTGGPGGITTIKGLAVSIQSTTGELYIGGGGQTRVRYLRETGDIASARPTCDSTMRGASWVTLGSSGEADLLSRCLKNASGGYGWVTVASGG